jgi:NAD(P)-dependent dehydrogenase (short-subunit alcohol dehydrogenase family)
MSRQIALVTGGTRGLGAAICRRIAAEGIHVAAVYANDAGSAAELRDELTAAGGAVSVHRCDVGSAAACRTLVDEVTRAHGPVTYLVSNAGLLAEARLADTSEELWQRAIDVNLSAAFHLAKAAWTGMAEAGFGRIVSIGSVTAAMGNSHEIAYGAAKAGLIGLTRSLARAGARHGITANCVVPGVFDTDMTASMPERARDAIGGLIPLRRVGRPAELAHAVWFLLHEDAAYVTGSVVTVDGGLSMGG